jgi:tRNA dimethylallyltransferase
MNCLVAVVGPTAAGKSKLALQLAKNFSGEIINADSRQIYRYMDIGTAKPASDELSLIKHHLIDLINPNESFSLAIYQKLAFETIEDIQGRNKLPLLVGGSGLYVWSVLEGWKVPPVPPDAEFRQTLEKKANDEGSYSLFQELQKLDPVAATKILPGNVRRIIRALEIYQKTGKPVSEMWQKKPPNYPTLIIGLTMQREALYRRIDLRIDEMIKLGLVDEVKDLIARGYSLDLPSMSGIGYKQLAMFIQGRMSLDAAVAQIKTETHRFARHQYAWFRTNDARIHWLSFSEDVLPEAFDLVSSFLAGVQSEARQS